MLDTIWLKMFRHQYLEFDADKYSIRKQIDFGTKFIFYSNHKLFRGELVGQSYNLEIGEEEYLNLTEDEMLKTISKNLEMKQ